MSRNRARIEELEWRLSNERMRNDDLLLRRDERLAKAYALLSDILLLEPHLKHYGDDGSLSDGIFRWNHERVHRAAEHIRGIDAAQSVGYSDGPAACDCELRS